jgi:hypothetical protein
VQQLEERGIAAPGNVLIDGVEVDQAGIGQHPALLKSQEGMLIQVGYFVVDLVAIAAVLTEQHLAGNRSLEDPPEQSIDLVGGHVAERDTGLAR